ncbi:hypothetical protein [Rhizobium sp. LC145]|uniref:hypothetical protein n=1 Tax=Rhizobium sp. LC145 TaxID=1120688 RepID=UPI00062A2246|nr:hypothetical protein [Rhizobium sp. LC145]KKX28218.1 hypothetical protein YH62_19200 [Rhizobium sp. LC145]TKT58364.1 hypothetical protein FDR95_12205 [Rhizobiaceae bacterium LC148]
MSHPPAVERMLEDLRRRGGELFVFDLDECEYPDEAVRYAKKHRLIKVDTAGSWTDYGWTYTLRDPDRKTLFEELRDRLYTAIYNWLDRPKQK